MSNRSNKKRMKNGETRNSLERKNRKLKAEICSMEEVLNAYQKTKKMLEKEIVSLNIYQSEFRETTDRKIQALINDIDNMEHTIKEESESKTKILAGQIMLVEEKMELEKRLEETIQELERYRNAPGIKGKILKALKI